MLQDFQNMNLWMFYLIGLIGFVLCWLRPRFVKWVSPIVLLVCVLFAFKIGESYSDTNPSSWRPTVSAGVLLSTIVAVGLPLVGALLGKRLR